MNNTNPLVSIIMPVYNMGEQLRDSIPKILKQTYKNIEVVLVDDGSSDNSLAVCNDFAQRDKRIKVIHQENSGSGFARNAGIRAAEGKYAYFYDADDLLEENAVEIMVETLEKNHCDLVVFGYRFCGLDGSVDRVKKFPLKILDGSDVRKSYDKYIHMRNEFGIQGAPWNKMFSLDKIKEYNIEFPELRRHQDEVFIMRYVDKADRIIFIPDVLYNHFPNDAAKVFQKFPEDYHEIVLSLLNYFMEYVYSWNPDNQEVLKEICAVFINGITKSLMLLFNPTRPMTFKERYVRVKEIAKKCTEAMPKDEYAYGSTLYKLMKKERYFALYICSYLSLIKNKKNLR